MLPHGRKDVKFDSKSKLYQLNELADLYNCNNVMFFEARKGKDLYMWLSKPPNGPTVKMHVQNSRPPSSRPPAAGPTAPLTPPRRRRRSAHHRRAPLHGQLPQGLAAHP